MQEKNIPTLDPDLLRALEEIKGEIDSDDGELEPAGEDRDLNIGV